MKKLLLLSLLLTCMLSCKKEQKDCNCGRVMSDDVTNYSVIVRNNCTDNEKSFILK